MAVQSHFFKKNAFFVEDGRPKFGKMQIRCLAQIHKGQLIRVCNDDQNTTVTVARGPYKENGNWKLDFQFRKDSSLWNRTILLADYSVIRNKDGNWNSPNWLEKA